MDKTINVTPCAFQVGGKPTFVKDDNGSIYKIIYDQGSRYVYLNNELHELDVTCCVATAT